MKFRRIGLAVTTIVLAASAAASDPIHARDYYTRKRVNGHWVTGIFPREQTAGKPAATNAPAARVVAQRSSTPEPETTGSLRAAMPAGAASGPAAATVPAVPAAATSLEPGASAPSGTGEGTGAQGTASAASAGPVARKPATVAFDLSSGIRTTWYSDGEIAEEPFDVARFTALGLVPEERK